MPRSSIDFLIESRSEGTRSREGSRQEGADDVLGRATTLFGGRILTTLQNAPGQTMRTYDLVDATGIEIQTLHQVLDGIATKYGWVEVEKNDKKGNYNVRLSDFGKQYLESNAR